MTQTKKIVHLTDLHLGKDDVNFQKTIDVLRKNCRPSTDYIILITGDIIDKPPKNPSTDDENIYGSALSKLRKLRDGDNGEDNYELFIVPGNHDYGTALKGIHPSSVSSFREKFKEFFPEGITRFPQKKVIGDIALIALDSMEGEFVSPKFADGKIGEAQLNSMEERIDEVEEGVHKVLFLHHHPVESAGWGGMPGFQLNDADELKRSLEKHPVDVLLHGHRHKYSKNKSDKWDSPSIPRIYDGGSSTGVDMKGDFKIRIIDLSSEKDDEIKVKGD